MKKKKVYYDKQLSQSHSSAKSFAVKAKPFCKKQQKKLKRAKELENEKIADKNVVYHPSNRHTHEYFVKTR